MIKKISEVLDEINIEMSNSIRKKLFSYDNLDAGNNSRVIEAYQDLCIGAVLSSNITAPVIKFYNTTGGAITIASSDYTYDTERGVLQLHNGHSNIGKIEVLIDIYPEANESLLARAWNQAAEDLNVDFHNNQLIQIDQPSYNTSGYITEIDTTKAPFNKISKFSRIFQDQNSKDVWRMEHRGDIIFLSPPEKNDSYDEPLSPYGDTIYEMPASWYTSDNSNRLSFPFFIEGSLNIPSIDLNNWATDIDVDFAIDFRMIKLLKKLVQYEVAYERFNYYTGIPGSGDAYSRTRNYQNKLLSISTEVFREGIKKQPPKMKWFGESYHKSSESRTTMDTYTSTFNS